MAKKIKVGVVFGGRSGEHEVSLVSSQSVIEIMDKEKYEVVPIKIEKDGKWDHSKLKGLDVVFPVLHGPFGEDGTIQGFFELEDIPYVGCGVLASSASMDKLMTKAIWEQVGLPVGPYLGFLRSQWEADKQKYVTEVFEEIGLPCFVKPANMGSSVGITKVKDLAELEKAIDLAAKFDRKIVVEKGIENRELECSVLGNEEPKASLPAEIILGGEFYDFNDKYLDGKSRAEIPANIPEHVMKEIQDLSIKAFRAVDGAGMARVDFFLENGTNKLYLNEINTIPGFTAISQYPKMWEASGLAYPDLIDRLIELAFERHEEKSKNQTTFESGSDWYK